MQSRPGDQKSIGACLAAARRRAKLTQQELAKRLGMLQSSVSEFEQGQRRIDVLEFLRIARALGTDPHEILDEIARTLRRPPKSAG